MIDWSPYPRGVRAGLVLVVLLVGLGEAAGQGCPPGARSVTLQNGCGVTLWIGAVGNRPKTIAGNDTCSSGVECNVNQYCDSAITRQCTFAPLGGTDTASTRACTTNANCAATEFCSTASHTCASLPPDGNGWEMAAGTTQTVCVPTPWAGRFWPRTGCRFSGTTCGAPGLDCCDTGSCLGEDDKTFALSCRLSAVPPATLAEPNFLAFPAEDVYDVSMVDGFNVAVEIAPVSGTFDPVAPPGTFFAPWCGRPGCAENCGEQAPCSWQLDASTCPALMQDAAPQRCTRDSDCPSPASTCDPAGVCTCRSSADCAAGQVCGTSPLNGGTRTCGPYVGCLSAAKACAADPALGAPLDCAANTDLYACTGATYGASCYTTGASSACCGCPSWSPVGTCAASNPRWTALAESTSLPPSTVGFAKTFHDVCANAYSYQFDDKVSTFSCRGSNASPQPDYAITFCPGGHGVPPPSDPCASIPGQGVAAVACACKRPPPPACNGTLPSGVGHRLARACTQIQGAAQAPRHLRRNRKLTRAIGTLGQARRVARRLARRDKTGCDAQLVVSVTDIVQRAKLARRTP
ncbi:MAG TPA: thaumatin family protein [Candidatus Binatia bacterium]|nr:thaumatin family protein [Candidatus Binatia bacterium]